MMARLLGKDGVRQKWGDSRSVWAPQDSLMGRYGEVDREGEESRIPTRLCFEQQTEGDAIHRNGESEEGSPSVPCWSCQVQDDCRHPTRDIWGGHGHLGVSSRLDLRTWGVIFITQRDYRY